MKKERAGAAEAARADGVRPPSSDLCASFGPGNPASRAYLLNRRTHERRPRPKPSSVAAVGIAALKKSDPRAASSACRRTRNASSSSSPGEERAASKAKIVAMMRLMPNERGRDGRNPQPQSLPSSDFGECQDGERKDKRDRTKRRPSALTRHHGAQPQDLRIESQLEKISASHGAVPTDRRQNQSEMPLAG